MTSNQSPLIRSLRNHGTFFLLAAATLGCQSLEAPQQVANRVAKMDHRGVSQCLSCHQTPPSGKSGNRIIFDHALVGATGECSACHSPQSPQLGISWNGASFTHQPKPKTCSACHDPERPKDSENWSTPYSDSPFNYSTHGAGEDCVTCHSVTQHFETQKDWSNGFYVHGGGARKFSHIERCSDCHSTERPLPGILHHGFDHAEKGQGDCVHCHAAPPSRSNKEPPSMDDWSGGKFDHSPLPTQCADCHERGRPKDSINWIGEKKDSPFDYATHGEGVDCASCHKNISHFNLKKDWVGGFYSHSEVPSESLGGKCNSCHEAQRPLPGVLQHGFDHGEKGKGDCIHCHSVPKDESTSNSATMESWSGGKFDHKPMPASCSDCHEKKRPIDTANWIAERKNSPFDYMTHGHGTDCNQCHLATNRFDSDKDWAGGFYSHSSDSASVGPMKKCDFCHTSQRPANGVLYQGFDHGEKGQGDCAPCHATPRAGSTNAQPEMNSWKGGKYSHTPLPVKCADCHNSSRPQDTQGWIGEKKESPFDYGTHGNSMDCASCHGSVSQFERKQNWTGGFLDHSSLPSKALGGRCDTCHSNQRPAKGVLYHGFDHAAQGQGDCVNCHSLTSPGSARLQPTLDDWKGGKFLHSNSLNQCMSCHEADRPNDTQGWTGYSSTSPFDYKTHALGMDCIQCHSSTQTYEKHQDWNGGYFEHFNVPSKYKGGTCSNCHETQRPAPEVLFGGYSHVGQGLRDDCITCHDSPWENTQKNPPRMRDWMVRTGG